MAQRKPKLWTEGDVFADWCASELIQSEDRFAGQPLVLEPWQRSFFDEALTVTNPDTLAPLWSTVALIVARKNGKTALLAALALYRLLNDDGRPEILLAAGTDKQAGKLFDACINYLRKNPALDSQVHRREYIGEIVNPTTGGKIIRLPSSGDTLDGANPSLVIADELHAWTTPTRQRVWTSLATADGARLQSQLFTITTAGDASGRHSSILGRLIDGAEELGDLERPHDGLTIARNREGSTLVYNYSAPTDDPTNVAAMKLANPASWVTEKYLASKAAGSALTAAQVLQLHGCVWAANETTFVPADVLGHRHVKDERLEDGMQVVLSFDGSEKQDETWLTATALNGYVEPLARWARPAGADKDWRIPRREVHRAVAAAFERFDVLELAADPPGWYAELDRWTERHGDVVVMFETRQPARMAPACERARTGLLDGTMRFGGPLGDKLAEHFGNCVVVTTPHGDTVRKDSNSSPRKIDGAITAIIGYDRAMWHAANKEDEWQPMVAFL